MLEDISRNDAVLCWGTTIALEALMMPASLSDEAYGAGQRAGREYVERYFQMVDGHTPGSFLPDNVMG